MSRLIKNGLNYKCSVCGRRGREPFDCDDCAEITGEMEVDGHKLHLHNNRSDKGAMAEAHDAEVVDLTDE